jgi:hypothetical protein
MLRLVREGDLFDLLLRVSSTEDVLNVRSGEVEGPWMSGRVAVSRLLDSNLQTMLVAGPVSPKESSSLVLLS